MKHALILLSPLVFLLVGCAGQTHRGEPSTSTGFEQLTANLNEAPSATLTKAQAIDTLEVLTGASSEESVEELAEGVCQMYEENFNPATDPGAISADVAELVHTDPNFSIAHSTEVFDPAALTLNETKILLVRSTEIACPKWTEDAFVYTRAATE